MTEQRPTCDELAARLAEAEARLDALRSEARFSKAFHASPAACMISELESGRIVEVNQALLAMTGSSRKEVVGRTDAELEFYLHANDRADVLRSLEQGGGHLELGEVMLRPRSGESRSAEVYLKIVEIDRRPCILTTLVDVTERVRAREGLREARDELERRVEERTAELAEANRRLTSEIEDRKRAEGQIRRKAAVLQAIGDIFQESLSCKTEDELGKACLAAAERLTDSEFGFLGEINPAGLLDAAAISDPGWEACNMAREDARESIRNMPIRGIFGMTLREGISQIVNGNEIATHPDRVGFPEGHPKLTAFLGVPLKHEGKIIGMIGLGNKPSGYAAADREAVEDLSVAIVEALRSKRGETDLQESHKRLRETLDELRATQEQVIQQERLRALGEMASGVCHDLNNSLSPVLGYAEMLLDDGWLPGTAREFLTQIHAGARDAAAVVARLREFYRRSSPGESRMALDLAALLEDVVQVTRPKWRDEALREGREIECQVRSEGVPPVVANAAEIREILTNLIFNAVDAMPHGGCIALRLRGQSEGVVVEVSDTGVGMPARVRARCFEPFFTTKGTEGTGLGLSVCHGIVERHGGRIEIESWQGQGTTVRVLLPAAEEALSVEESEAEPSLPRSRVLYIDDDPRTRAVVGEMLRSLGQEVDLAEGGSHGLELVEANHYDLVITDRGMPEMDGYVVTGKIKALRPELPVGMLTGWGSSGPAASMESGEAPDYILSKPPSLDEMRALLRKLLR